jgi:uncharacterized protein
VSVREQMVALAKLGRIDASTHELDRELKDIPKEVASLREAVSLLEGLLSKERHDLEQAQTLRSTQETLIKEAQDAISRTKAKGAKAKTAREAEAVERELESGRRTVKDRELERDKLGAAIEQVQKSLAQHETEFLGLREVLAQKDAEAQVRIAELNAGREQALLGRDAIVALVPKDILRRYDAFRQRKGSGVAEVRDGICLGCRVAVRPQQHIVIQREGAIEQCAQCQRYLYLASWVADDVATLEAGER